MLRLSLAATAATLALAATTASAVPPPSLLTPGAWKATAPNVYSVAFVTTKGTFVVTVHRAWAPKGADRFYNLVRAKFYDGDEFFRAVKGFVVQFGINPSPEVSSAWVNAAIKDDPVKRSNTVGTITYADAGPDSRTTQVFINLGKNAFLDTQGFAPFGTVTKGMAVVEKLYEGYGEKPTGDQELIYGQGNSFLKKNFPKLDGVISARLVASH